MTLRVRKYGTSGPLVAVLHGGPGAPGYVAPVAQGLAAAFRVLEPFQRGSHDGALSVARHVDDLDDVLRAHCGDSRVALVGHSWGAMLALAYAAAHPERTTSLVLVGSGTFTVDARARMKEILAKRTDETLRRRIEQLQVDGEDSDENLRRRAEMTLPLYSYAVESMNAEFEPCDARAHQETWDDMTRLQAAGIYPRAFATIAAPVIMLHGAADPHPGRMIHDSLSPYLPQLEYVEWERCGHYPWLEPSAHDDFFRVLLEWLARHECRHD